MISLFDWKNLHEQKVFKAWNYSLIFYKEMKAPHFLPTFPDTFVGTLIAFRDPLSVGLQNGMETLDGGKR